MAERYTRQYRKNEQRKDVRLVEVPPALFTRDSTGSPASSSATNYDEQSRTMTMFDDTSDDIGHCEPLTPTFPYRQCYETGRPFLYSQQQVVPSPGGKVGLWGSLPAATPETMVYNGNNVSTPPRQPHAQLPQSSLHKGHCPPLENLWKATNSSSSDTVLPPVDVVTNSGVTTGSSSSDIGDNRRKYRETVFGLGPRFAAALCMIIVFTIGAVVACIVMSKKV